MAVLDVLFIVFCVPESLPSKRAPPTTNEVFNWQQADPFGSLRLVWEDKLVGFFSCFITFRRNCILQREMSFYFKSSGQEYMLLLKRSDFMMLTIFDI